MSRQIIYIPGLGDQRVTGQKLAINVWWLYGVHPHLFQINWADGQPFEAKFERLLDTIDELSRKGPVYVVAASAGAMVALSAFQQRPKAVRGIVCIAGVLQNFRTAPANSGNHDSFAAASYRAGQAMAQLNAKQKQQILSIRGQYDPVVSPATSVIPGAYNKQLATRGHAAVIARQLTFGAPGMLRFLKRLR